MELRRSAALRRLLLAADVLAFFVAAHVAFALHAAARGRVPWLRDPPPETGPPLVAWLLLPIWGLVLLVMRGGPALRDVLDPGRRLAHLAALHGAALIGFTLALFLSQEVVNRSLIVLLLAVTFVLMLAERTALAAWLRRQHVTAEPTRILLVGEASERTAEFARAAARDVLPAAVVGRLGPAGPDAAFVSWAGEVAELERVLHAGAVDRVVFFPPHDRPEAARESLAVLEMFGIPAHFAVPQVVVAPRLSVLYGTPFVSYETAPKDPEELAVKHALDFVLAALGLVLLSPLLLGVWLAVLASMGAPAFFAQERVGLHGRRFRVLKFRTMVRGAEEQREALLGRNETGGPAFKMREDPRVTPLGRLLRRFSLDELPQLVNVLLGSMSLVGPRPLPPQEQLDVRGGHRRRLSMKPGITGLWQVSGRNELDFDEWMRLDLAYVDAWSLGLDLRILLRTLPAVLLGRGAR